METLFVFLRGINVGGHNKIAMQDLRQMLSDLGFKDVKTHIQTGNIVLKTQLIDNSNCQENRAIYSRKFWLKHTNFSKNKSRP